jgi:hypothetical protein
MAPASVAGAAPRARRGREAKWTRENVIEKIRRWAELYGEPPRAADWNPSSAKWAAQTYRIARYRLGDPATGEPWPSLNAAKRPFGGSLNAAVRAAGLEPARPGPKRRGTLGPERLGAAEMPPEVRAELGGVLAAAEADRRRVGVLERRLERAQERASRLERELDGARNTKSIVTNPRQLDRAQAQVARARTEARAAVGEAKVDAAEARRMATRLAARLERAEATVAEVRSERRELVRERELAEGRAVAARAAVVIVREPAPEAAAVDAAREAAAAARRSLAAAQLRAARAEREYRELASAVTGEQRRLTAGELAKLRRSGPAGPAVLAAALKQLARARSGNAPVGLSAALGEVASAAVSWQERIR